MYRIRKIERMAYIFLGALIQKLGLGQLLIPKHKDTPNPQHVIFVCTGNICRSPYAEVKLRNVLAERGIDSIAVSSYGMDTTPGKPANETARAVAAKRNIDLEQHATQQLSKECIDKASLVLVMAPHHRRAVAALRPGSLSRVAYLGAFGLANNTPLVLADPYSLPEEEFVLCFNNIDTAILGLADYLAKTLKA